MAHKRVFDGTEATSGHARAVRAENMVFVAGTTALRKDGLIDGSDVYSQTVAAYDKIEAALSAAGVTLADVVRVAAYITDMNQSGGFIRAQTEQFKGGLVPAAALIGGVELPRPDPLIEIEATAVLTQD